MFVLFLAIIPSVLWDQGPETAATLERAGIREIATTRDPAGWQATRVRAVAADPAAAIVEPARADIAAATVEAYANAKKVYFRLKQDDLPVFASAVRFLQAAEGPGLERFDGKVRLAGAEAKAIVYRSPTFTRIDLIHRGGAPVKDLRVAVPGRFSRVVLAIPGEKISVASEIVYRGGMTHFRMPEFANVAIVHLDPSAAEPLRSAHSSAEFALTADPQAPHWRAVSPTVIRGGVFGEALPTGPTEVRSHWTADSLYLLFTCPYTELFLKPGEPSANETPALWTWEVAEAFIGADFEHIGRYREFQVSPRGEWVDLDIDVLNPKPGGGMSWNSGYQVKARIDADRHIWFGEMRIPLRSIGERAWGPGDEMRLGLFRILGPEHDRRLAAWRPPYRRSFHTPEAFGTLRLEK